VWAAWSSTLMLKVKSGASLVADSSRRALLGIVER
jgi:hypothetical protein